MINALIGQKLDQAQSFLENGKRVPVTEIALADNVVLQVKTQEKDAYAAVQLGAGSKKKAIKAVVGHAKKAGQKNASIKIKEIRLEDVSEEGIKAGDLLSVDVVFKPGDRVTVSGTSKGKGFAGGVKRHGFRGGPKTHGQSDRHRAPGSIGQGTTPGRVYKGKRMAGRMGSDTVTVSNLTVVDVDAESKKLYVSGLVPGHKNSWVMITKTGEDKKFVPLLSVKEEPEKSPVVTPDEAVVTPEETVVEPVETVATPSETVEDVKTASAESASEPKEVKSDMQEDEKKALDAEEKEEMSKAAEENVAEEKSAKNEEKEEKNA